MATDRKPGLPQSFRGTFDIGTIRLVGLVDVVMAKFPQPTQGIADSKGVYLHFAEFALRRWTSVA